MKGQRRSGRISAQAGVTTTATTAGSGQARRGRTEAVAQKARRRVETQHGKAAEIAGLAEQCGYQLGEQLRDTASVGKLREAWRWSREPSDSGSRQLVLFEHGATAGDDTEVRAAVLESEYGRGLYYASMARRGSALGYYDGNIVTEREYKRLNEDTGLRHTLQVQGGQWVNGLHGVTGMQFANTARGGNGQNNAKFGFDTDVVRVDATEVQRGQPVLINYKWPTAAWDEIESRIVGLCAWEGYDGGQGLGTEGGAFVDQLLVALRRGGIGAMMLRTVRRGCRATDGRVELQRT